MATLAAIGITFGAGLGIFTITLGCFTAAVIKRNVFVAGRCVARPKDVIYNPNPKHPCQQRGYTPWGWMSWAMSLSYDTLLSGVPGTGTREGGLKGHLLKVNLDNIVILRYHFLGMKVCALATVLYLAVIMPVYSTARCSSLRGDLNTPECINITLTDYQQLTLANIPTLDPYEDEDNLFGSLVDVIERQNMGRLYMVAVCTWLITWYTMKLLHMEWLDILAMRRVYYLEADHWKDRMEELGNVAEEQNRKDASRIGKRPVWVPHPELRDTVPNIELYSILVGGLPSLPTDAMQDVEAVFSKKQSMDWQLSVTTAFFDHCVPNQPGFSSSVAAVTILPAATQITDAWQQWYKAAAKVRKLRYMRERIKYVRGKEGSDTSEGSGSDGDLGIGNKSGRPVLTRRTSVHDDDVLGSQTDVEVEDHLFHALNLGPEQTAVYGREFAQGAANFAPHGWFEWRINNAGLKELLVMEEAAARDVRQANMELQEARDRIAESSEGESQESERLSSTEFKTTAAGSEQLDLDQGIKSTKASASTMRQTSAPSSGKSLKQPFAPSLSGDPLGMPKSTKSKNDVDNPESSSHSHSSVDLDGSHRQSETSPRRSGKSKKLSRASMAQLPTALGLEAGLWAEQNKLSTGSEQHIPRLRKSRGRSGQPRRVMSVDIDAVRQKGGMDSTAKNYYNDIAKMKGRNSNDGANRTLVKRNSFDDDQLSNSNRLQRPSLKRAVTTGTPAVDMGNVSTLLKNILETGEGEARAETSDDESEVSLNSQNGDDKRKSGSQSSGSLSIWETLEEDEKRKGSLRARMSQRRLEIDSSDETRPKALEIKKTEPKTAETVSRSANGAVTRVTAATQPMVDGAEQKAHTTAPSSITRPQESNIEGSAAQNVTPTWGHESTTSYTDWVNEGVQEEVEENLEIAYNFEQRAGLRKRENVVSDTQDGKHTEKWRKVMTIVEETAKDMNGGNAKKRVISSGRWTCPSFHSICRGMNDRVFKCLDNIKIKSPELLDDFARDSTYAVVTFTSRQAAVAARHSLADSRGADRWVNLNDLPTPPLADAPACSRSCRGCMRPVTLSISDTQKKIRHFFLLCFLAIVYFFYTIPLTAVQDMVSPERLTELYPEISEAQESNPLMANIFLGFIPALIWILFFAICPPLFKFISNFGSNATSSVKAENSALKYFWWFMVLSAFTGTAFQSAVVDGFRDGIRIGSELQKLVEETAKNIPIRVSSNWLNWIIARMFVVLPTQYLLQTNTFLFTWLGWNCCQRAVRGGGAGPPIPYRIYVDSGVVLLCLFALAPSSPLIAPAAFIYFLVCLPLLRWTMIFLYKPKIDVGGGRFPFIFDVLVSGMVVGQVLLTTMMLLKQATGPALAAIMPFLPTVFYRYTLRRKYLRAFEDAALLQTSLLDGWDNEDDTTDEDREEFRKFIVDCHKAAYVPVCIASGVARTLITAEPAVVIPMEGDPSDDELFGCNLSEDSTDTFPPVPVTPLGSSRQLRTLNNTTAGARVPLNSLRSSFTSPQRKTRKSIEEGTAIPSLPSLPLQPGAMMRRPSYTLRTPRAAPGSPGSHVSPASFSATMPASPAIGRRASNGSTGSRRRASNESPGQGRRTRRGSNESPGQGRRESFAGMKGSVNSSRSPRPGSQNLLLSPALQQSQRSQPGKMMRRTSRSARMQQTNNASLPSTPELPFR